MERNRWSALRSDAELVSTSDVRTPKYDRERDLIQSLCLLLRGQDITITTINDGQYRAVEELSAGSSEGSVVSSVVVDAALSEHGHVFNLGLSKVGAV